MNGMREAKICTGTYMGSFLCLLCMVVGISIMFSYTLSL